MGPIKNQKHFFPNSPDIHRYNFEAFEPQKEPTLKTNLKSMTHTHDLSGSNNKPYRSHDRKGTNHFFTYL